MSQVRTDLDNSEEKARFILSVLASLPFVDKVFINGSRSPNGNRAAREASDWDFVCVCAEGFNPRKLRMKTLREAYGFHGDAVFIFNEHLHYYKQAIEIWPSNEHGVLTNE